MEKNEQEWYLSGIKWGVQLVLNGTVNLVSFFLWSSDRCVVNRGPPNAFSGIHGDSILNFTVSKQKQQGIQMP